MTTICEHESAKDMSITAYSGTVAVHPHTAEERRAHGGFEARVRCDACGAERRELRNGDHVEVGPWMLGGRVVVPPSDDAPDAPVVIDEYTSRWTPALSPSAPAVGTEVRLAHSHDGRELGEFLSVLRAEGLDVEWDGGDETHDLGTVR